jgi:hypothetical protein
MFVYLCGSIRKGSSDDRDPGNFWGDDEEKALLAPVRSAEVVTLNPARTDLRRNDYYANFGCDLHLVTKSDVVVVDARTEKGVGVGAEMMFARERNIPVITVAPPNTNYRRDFVPDVFGEDLRDWIHPFIFGLSTRIVDGFEDAGHLLEQLATGQWRPVLSPSTHKAIDYYLSTASHTGSGSPCLVASPSTNTNFASGTSSTDGATVVR